MKEKRRITVGEREKIKKEKRKNKNMDMANKMYRNTILKRMNHRAVKKRGGGGGEKKMNKIKT